MTGLDYFISSSVWNDNNSGTSQNLPWKNLTKVSKSRFAPGDRILLKKNDIWHQELLFPVSGNEKNKIIITSYGEGKKPIISGSMVIENWEGEKDGVFTFSLGNQCYTLIEDNIPIRKASSELLNDGNWYVTPTTIYYKPTIGKFSDHIVERGSKKTCISFINLHDIILDGIHIYGANGFGVLIKDSSRIEVRNCIVARNAHDGILINASQQKTIIKEIAIKNNIVVWNSDGIYIRGLGNASHCIFSNNIIAYNNYDLLLSHNTTDGHAIGAQHIDNSKFEGNDIHHNYTGIALWAGIKSHSNNNEFLRNYIHDNQRFGIAQGGDKTNNSTNNIWAYNIVANNGSAEGWDGGIRINRNQDPPNYFLHNTLFGNDINFYLYSYVGGSIIKNNISLSPKNYHLFIYSERGRTNIIDMNCYFSHDLASFRYKEKDNLTFKEWKDLTGHDNQSFYTDPLLATQTPSRDVDFKLKGPESPCVDKGEAINISEYQITSDYFKNDIIGKPDIGAAENHDVDPLTNAHK